MRIHGLTVAGCVLLIVSLMHGIAAGAITPISATTTDPIAYTAYGSSTANVIDGVINYDQWLALGQEGSGAFAGPYTVTFDLGATCDLTGFNLWNNGGNTGGDGEGVDAFTLTFYDPSSAVVGTFTGNANDLLAMQPFSFTASDVQTVDFTINSNHAPGSRRYVIFYEANFEGTVVPAPGALLLALIGLGAIAGIRSRRNNVL